MNNEQALQTLFNAARQANLPADAHALVQKCAEQLAEVIKLAIKED